MRSLAGCLPMLAFAALACFFATRRSAPAARSWRDAIVQAAVAWGLLIIVICEGLSLFHALRPVPVALAWAAFIAAAGVAVRRAGLVPGCPALAPGERRLLAGAALLWTLVGVAGLAAGPATVDSLTYHLPRLMHWVQNHGVQHYATAVARQLFMPPWSEFAMAQYQLLTGDDRWFFSVQWGAALVTAIAVSLLVKQTGAGRHTQAAAGFLTLTVPMTVLQGSSTQNDLSASAWHAIALLFGSRWLSREAKPSDALWCGAAAGLGLLTKGTLYPYLLPLAVLMVWDACRTARRARWSALLMAGLAAVAINAGHWSRNVRLFGSPLGPSNHYAVSGPSFGTTASNVLRNGAIHAALLDARWNAGVEKAVAAAHRWLNIPLNDVRTTWGWAYGVLRFAPSENSAGAPLHAALLALTLIAAPWTLRRRPEARDWAWLAALLAAEFVLFCATVKWQPWHGRLHLPLLTASCALLAIGLEALGSARIRALVLCGLWGFALMMAVFGAERSLAGPRSILGVPRLSQLFLRQPESQPPLRELVQTLASRSCSSLALRSESSQFEEYKLWAMLRAEGVSAAVRYEQVPNASRALEDHAPACMTLTIPRVENGLDGHPEM